MKNAGIAYGVGVGPGDPELMTLKAVRLIRENDVIAFPGREPKMTVAYQIAAAVVPEIADKELVPVNMPMTNDKEQREREHRNGAALLEHYLDQGKNVVYLTLGDPTIYCTFSYLQRILEMDGYTVELVSGIPSFCAAAAKLHIPLAEWDEELHVMPAIHEMHNPLRRQADLWGQDSLRVQGDIREQDDLRGQDSLRGQGYLQGQGTYVLMKSASHMKEIKQLLKKSGLAVSAVENCGMETERIYHSLEEIPDDAGYFSVIIAKKS